jgi:gamma-glutamylcyclotransferase (GGCT)/AIG2-like uncharacterized protein YtfP
MGYIFAYGTLQNSEIIKALLGKELPMEKAKLNGFRVFGLAGQFYPAMIPNFGSTATGLLIHSVDKKDLEIIIEWEGNNYKLIEVNIDGVSAACFLWIGSCENFVDQWSNEDFRQKDMRYIVDSKIPQFLDSRSVD